jgi:hypothetical protein
MPRKPWVPLPHEAKRFHEIYIDETSQNGHHFLVLGGIIIPLELSADFEADMISARRKPLDSRGGPREMGWKKISNGDYAEYERVLGAFFSYAHRRNLGPSRVIRFYASVVDTSVPGRRYSLGKRGQIGFNREIYYHCLSIGRRERGPRGPLFHVYPDERSTSEPVEKLKGMLNSQMLKENDVRDHPFRRVKFRKSHEHQALQVSDILIGAIAFRLNRSYDQPTANKDKKLICDYVFKKTGFIVGPTSFKPKRFGEYQLKFRKHLE